MKTKIACVAILLVVVGLVAAQTRPRKAEPVDPVTTLTDLNTGQTWEWTPQKASSVPPLEIAYNSPPAPIVECWSEVLTVIDFDPKPSRLMFDVACNGDPECSVMLVYEGYDWQGEEYGWFLPCTLYSNPTYDACEEGLSFGVGSTLNFDRVVIRNGTLVNYEVQDCE